MRRFYKLIFVLAAFVPGLPALAQDDTRPSFEDRRGTIDIQGMGEVTATPDLAYVTSGVITQGETAREALTANTAAMDKLIEVLKSAGIEDRDIQTANFSIQPQYVYHDRDNANRPPRIEGYQVSNQVTVRVRKLDSLGTVLDQIVSVGANSIDQVSFAVADTNALMDEARKKAFANAADTASLYADAAGIGLGDIVSISESSGFTPAPRAMRMAADTMESAVPVPIQSGELTYSIMVMVRWEIEQ